MLLAAGADVNARDGQGRTPPHDASGDEALLLLEHDAEVNALDAHGDTPLHVAAARGDLEMVGALVNVGAPLSLVNADGLTPLALAERAGHGAVAEALRGLGPH